MTRAFIGLGSNLGDRKLNLERALELLQERGVLLIEVSSFHETAPLGPPQPDFLNAVCAVETESGPRDLLGMMKEIEGEMGRTQAERWGPRIIDLDLLIYGEEAIDEVDLKVPHPEMKKRAFVMEPLSELSTWEADSS